MSDVRARVATRGGVWLRLLGPCLVWSGAVWAVGLQDAPARAQIPDEVLQKVKHATVHLKAKLANGQPSEGSAWFVGKGFLITNAHVLNMQGGDKRFPSKIEVTIDGGEASSRVVSAKYHGANYASDLMLLQVEGPAEDLPEPLSLNPEAPLNETQTVYVFGYPLGQQLGKSITVSKASISSLRRVKGVLKEIQLDGGIHPGNSGGPIVNEKGEVIGVAVAGIEGTAIKFAIPAAPVSDMVYGRYSGMDLEQTYWEDDKTKIRFPFTIRFFDPMTVLKSIRIEYWTNPNPDTKSRPGGYTQPEPVEGDSPIETVEPVREPPKFPKVEIVLPVLPDSNSRYWFRTTLVDGRGRQYWSAAWTPRPDPLERRDVMIPFTAVSGTRKPIEITNESSFKFQVGTRSETLKMHVQAIANPTLFAPDADGDQRGRLTYSSVTLGMTKDGEAVQAKEKWRPLGQNFLKTAASIRYAPDGAVVYAQPELRNSAPQFKDELVGISNLVLQTLELMSVPLSPNGFKPKDTVRLQKMLLVGLPEMYVPTHSDTKYQFRGVHQIQGQDLAHFNISATLRPRRGDENQLTGNLEGTLDVLLETGEVIYGNGKMDVEYDLPGAKGLRLVGALSVFLRPAPEQSTQQTTKDPAKPAEGAGAPEQ
ncbi:MAG: trypsin-like peptidase domain-containing protein [Planctomycetes bacterium]|nr:trypsin-like peptidase domain-containing protein [Planctomycetota bacterium]